MNVFKMSLAAIAAVVSFQVVDANAQNWPTKPVRLIIPFQEGGSGDTVGRLMADVIRKETGREVVVENRVGMTGVQQAVRAAPDGHTLMIASLGSHVVAPVFNGTTEDFDPLRDLTHIAYGGGPPMVLVASPAVQGATLPQIVANLKASGRKLTYGSPGNGTFGHLMAEHFLSEAGLTMEHIPYRGSDGAVKDAASEKIDFASLTLASAMDEIKSDKVRGLAVTSKARMPNLPEVPTFAELGYSVVVGETWFGLAGPAGMPRPVVERINAMIVKGLSMPEIQKVMTDGTLANYPMSAAEYQKFVQEDIAKWSPLAKAAAAKAK